MTGSGGAGGARTLPVGEHTATSRLVAANGLGSDERRAPVPPFGFASPSTAALQGARARRLYETKTAPTADMAKRAREVLRRFEAA